MDNNRQLLASILSAAIRNKNTDISMQNADIRELFVLAKHHQVESLTYPLIKELYKSKRNAEKKILEIWKNDALKQALKQNRYMEGTTKVVRALADAGIPVIALKGIVLKDFYPKPEMRSMMDVDFLIKDIHMNSVIKILRKIGYHKKASDNKHTTLASPRHLFIELHTGLVKERFIDKAAQWEKSIWDRCIDYNFNGVSMLTLSLEDHLVYLCIHLANHLVSSGFGLRQLCDLVVYVEKNNNEIDWLEFVKKTEELGIKQFVITLMQVCTRLFDLKVPEYYKLHIVEDNNLNQFIEYIFSGGVFGKNETRRIIGSYYINAMGKAKIENMPGTFRRVIVLLFPPYRYMCNKYKLLIKVPILLPITWIYRIIINVFKREKVLSHKFDIKSFSKSNIQFDEHYKLLKWMELI
jgi:hypothetical protein